MATRKPKKKRSALRKFGRASLLTFLLLVVGGAAALVIGYVITPVPDPNKFVTANATIVYYADGKTQMGTFAARNRTSVELDEISKKAQDATVAAENRDFWTDHGVSITGILRAGWRDIRHNQTQGASTITQQYVKNYYLTEDQTWSRKIRELFITLKVQRQMSKEDILAGYLNTVYYGRGAYGIEAAAQTYFGISAKDLNARQGAVLASLLKAPSNYDPAVSKDNTKRLLNRYRYVLGGMAELGDYPKAKVAKAKLPAMESDEPEQQYKGPKGYLLVQVKKELIAQGMSEQEVTAGGLRVTTTIDRKAQAAAERAVTENWPDKPNDGVHIGLASVEPGTGRVIAAYGGKDYLKRAFSDATQARFQPGSTFKAFTLAAMLEDGISLKSRFSGNTLHIGNETVYNDGHHEYGPSVDMLHATASSINTAFVDVTQTIGPERVVDAAVAAGVPREPKNLQPVPVVTLGVASETPLTMANAYATFAAGGKRATAHIVDSVSTRGGREVYTAANSSKRAFDADVVADVTYALQQVVRSGTGTKAQAVGRPVAGKTGTHEDLTAWFIGFTPQVSTAVGLYREDSKGLPKPLTGVAGHSAIFGANYPLDVWTDYMTTVLDGMPVENFPEPAWVGTTNGTIPSTSAPKTEAPETAEATPTATPTPTPTPSLPPVPTTPPPPDTPEPTQEPPDTPEPTQEPPDTPEPTQEPPDTPKPTPPPSTPKPTQKPGDEIVMTR